MKKENFEFFSKVLGSSFTDNAQEVFSILEQRDELVLVPEPDNKFDANAILIYFGEEKLGYVAKETAAKIVEDTVKGNVTCEVATVTGGGELNYGCNILLKVARESKTEDKSNDNQIKII
jgi:hypothetical protein